MSPRAPPQLHAAKGQQIWLDARADGHSPDERDALQKLPHGRAVAVAACVLILATSFERNPMKQSRVSNNLASSKPTSKARIAFISATWHTDIVVRARDAFLAEAARLGQPGKTIDLHEVPGAFEIPLHAQKLAQSGRYDAIVGCALVVDGGIYRHEFVAHAVIDGLMRVQLDTGVPVLSAVLTPKDFHEHAEHLKFFSEHFVKKGAEAARACVATIVALRKLKVVA